MSASIVIKIQSVIGVRIEQIQFNIVLIQNEGSQLRLMPDNEIFV